MLNIAFRADSSHEMGTGHIMRCMTLAHALKKQCDVNIYFFCRQTQRNINSLIQKAGFNLVVMRPPAAVKSTHIEHSRWLGATQDADAREFLSLTQNLPLTAFDYLIIDHYAIDQIWQKIVKQHTKKIMVIDDLGNRFHYCDYLLDQTFNCPNNKYSSRTTSDCRLLLGSDYTLLRDEFKIPPVITKARTRRDMRNLLVMFGGTDPNNLTLKTLEILEKNKKFKEVNIILGAAAAHLQSVISFTEKKTNFKLHIAPANIAELMLSADLAIGSAGTSSWERCAAGLPSIIIIDGENQREIARQLKIFGVISYLEEEQIISHLQPQIDYWLNNRADYEQAINKCLTICDGYGSQRIADALLY